MSLVSLLVLLPLLTDTGTSRLWLTAILTLIMIAGPLTLATRRFDFYLSLILGSVMTATTWIDIIFKLFPVELIGRIATVAFFIMLAGLIFRQYLFEKNHMLTSICSELPSVGVLPVVVVVVVVVVVSSLGLAEYTSVVV